MRFSHYSSLVTFYFSYKQKHPCAGCLRCAERNPTLPWRLTIGIGHGAGEGGHGSACCTLEKHYRRL
jgi:hypothetical protein